MDESRGYRPASGSAVRKKCRYKGNDQDRREETDLEQVLIGKVQKTACYILQGQHQVEAPSSGRELGMERHIVQVEGIGINCEMIQDRQQADTKQRQEASCGTK